MTVRRRAALILLVAAILLAAAFFAAPRREGGASEAAPATRPAVSPTALHYAEGAPQLAMLRTGSAEAVALPLTEPLAARLAYDDDATARIGAGFAGRITRVAVAPGDPVTAGQLLATIDSADIGTARADLDKARADEERKRLTLDRAGALGAGEGIAARDVEAARADYAEARAETARAAERVRTLRTMGKPLGGQLIGITAPIAGIVAERHATVAAEVAQGADSPLFVITDPRKLWLMIDVPERLLGRVGTGGAVEIESDAFPGRRFQARIERIGAALDPDTRRVTARARVDNDDRALLPEMFVRARIVQPGQKAVRVPVGAVVDSGANAYVFVETQAGTFTRRKVELLSRDDDYCFVSAGLTGGERVVVKGALLLDGEMASAANDAS